MADQASLRLIGLIFGAVTVAVMLMAAVAFAGLEGIDQAAPTAALASSTG